MSFVNSIFLNADTSSCVGAFFGGCAGYCIGKTVLWGAYKIGLISEKTKDSSYVPYALAALGALTIGALAVNFAESYKTLQKKYETEKELAANNFWVGKQYEDIVRKQYNHIAELKAKIASLSPPQKTR